VRLCKPRIRPLQENELTPEQRGVLETLEQRARSFNVFRTLARHPKLAQRFVSTIQYILSESTLLPRDRELLILRIGWLCQSEYEWSRHAILAKEVGLTDRDIRRIMEGSGAEGWTAFESTLLRAVDELYEDAFISEATWNTLAKEYSERQLMDLVLTVGQYNLLSMALNSFGVQLDEDAIGFPETNVPDKSRKMR
jgi:4-carboxymuconolactone decarboxylase